MRLHMTFSTFLLCVVQTTSVVTALGSSSGNIPLGVGLGNNDAFKLDTYVSSTDTNNQEPTPATAPRVVDYTTRMQGTTGVAGGSSYGSSGLPASTASTSTSSTGSAPLTYDAATGQASGASVSPNFQQAAIGTNAGAMSNNAQVVGKAIDNTMDNSEATDSTSTSGATTSLTPSSQALTTPKMAAIIGGVGLTAGAYAIYRNKKKGYNSQTKANIQQSRIAQKLQSAGRNIPKGFIQKLKYFLHR